MKLRLAVSMVLSLLLMTATALSATAAGVGGSLDTTYGGTGKVVGPVLTGVLLSHPAIQTDDKVITVGASGAGDFLTARHNTDGTLDATFGAGGSVSTDIGAATADVAEAAAVQSDGAVVVAGMTSTGGGDFAVVRYTTAGVLDTTFGATGKVVTDIGAVTADIPFATAIQSDGKIVVVGSSAGDFAVVRYTTAGVLDTTFDTDGKVTTDIGAATADTAFDVAIQSDGKIVVGGSSSGDFAVARYTSAGVLDTTFDTDGKQTTDFAAGGDAAFGVAIDVTGRIVLVGGVTAATTDFGLARYTTAGALDTTFDTDGKVTTDIGAATADTGTGVAIQTDGRIVAEGVSAADFAVARYNYNGALDTSFDTDGKVVTDIAAGVDTGLGVRVQRDGQIVVNGVAAASLANVRYNYGTYLYRADAIIGKTGDNIYWNPQKQNVRVLAGKSKSVKVKIQNDGTASDSFMVLGAKNKSPFTVTYWKGTKNITKKVVKGTYTTAALAAGASETIKVKITAKAGAKKGKKKSFKVTATSVGYAGSVDTVKAKAKVA